MVENNNYKHAIYINKHHSLYFQAMGWSCDNPPNNEVIEATLKRAHDTRKFEIELYWKRANYFWLLQAAVLTALGLSLKFKQDMANIPDFLAHSIACLGFLCAFAGYLSAKGSKFWQENWEKHIDVLEDTIEGRLYKTIWLGRDGVSYSVSRVNNALLLCFNIFWAVLALVLYKEYYCNYGLSLIKIKLWELESFIGNLLFLGALSIAFYFWRYTKSKLPRNLTGRVYNEMANTRINSWDIDRWIKRN